MSLIWKLVAFDRATELLTEAYEIPGERVLRAKELAGIAKDDPDNLGDCPLSAAQAAAVARLIDRPIDPARYDYTLEPYSQPLHTISKVALLGAAKLQLIFDDRDLTSVDLSSMLAQGGVFEPLRDPQQFERVQIGPHGRTLVWRHASEEGDIELCADALWLMAHPDHTVT